MIKSSRTIIMLIVFVLFVAIGLLVRLVKPDSFSFPAADAYPPPPTLDASKSSYPGPSAVETLEPTPQLPLASGPKIFRTYLPVVETLGNPKKGLAWNRIEEQDSVNLLNISWFHNWSSAIQPPAPVPPQLEYIPFLWCDFTNGPSPFDLLAYALNNLGSDYDGYLLFLNEPDLGAQYGQCDLTNPAEAAVFYVEARYSFPAAKFIGPHNYHGDENWHASAIAWTTEWREAVYAYTCSGSNPYPNDIPCGYPDMAGYGIHPYEADAVPNLVYVDDFYNLMVSWGEGDKELWVTEWGYCINQIGAGDAVTFTVNEFESRPYVTRYSYYTNRTPGNDTNKPVTGPECWDTDLFDPYANPPWSTLSGTGEAYRDVANP